MSDELQFGSDFVGIVLDAHNGLQLHATKYTGLEYVTAMGTTTFDDYKMLMKELSSFSQVVYGYSPCHERFALDARLDSDASACAAIATSFGIVPYSLADFWDRIKPFCLNMESEGKATNLWHRTDYGQDCKLHYFCDQLIKKLIYLSVANSWGDRSRLR
ncbi:MAG: hypothetical protein ACKPKO_43505, partial [Candidatus Fonsibacter sp.]